MSPFVNDPDFVLHVGDALEVLATLPDESVHCVVTSPPYWGLRDYGTGSWEGGTDGCDHVPSAAPRSSRPAGGLTGGKATVDAGTILKDSCKCGARRVDHQLGLEPTPEEYVTSMVAVFREVRRVLRRDGTCWLNIGDSYATTAPGTRNGAGTGLQAKPEQIAQRGDWRESAYPIKAKDLVGIPWRLAFALQADGWYLRSDIIWSKPNPMPESVTDRPTKAHEYLFLLTKSARYFYDADAIREDYTPDGRKVTTVQSGNGAIDLRGISQRERWAHGGRNKRSVWEIATEPYPDAHFATFPQALVEPCLKAGCPEGGTVLDPFMGSGTVAVVARRLGRRAVGIELNPKYALLASKRLQQLSLLAA